MRGGRGYFLFVSSLVTRVTIKHKKVTCIKAFFWPRSFNYLMSKSVSDVSMSSRLERHEARMARVMAEKEEEGEGDRKARARSCESPEEDKEIEGTGLRYNIEEPGPAQKPKFSSPPKKLHS